MALSENINALEKAKFVEFSGETAVRVYVVNQSSGGVGSSSPSNYGLVQIPNGQDNLDITFLTEMLNTDYTVVLTIQTDEQNPTVLSYLISDKTTTGFKANFNAPADSDLYFVNYIIEGVTVGTPQDTLTQQTGDARYYTRVLLDGGQLDTRYYTETEIDNLLASVIIPNITSHSINFLNEQNKATLTVLDASASSTYLYSAFSDDEDLRIQGVSFYVENIVNGVSFDIVGIAPQMASGQYTIKVKREVVSVN